MARKKSEQKTEEQVLEVVENAEVEISAVNELEQLDKQVKSTVSEVNKLQKTVERLSGELKETQEINGILRDEVFKLQKGWKVEAVLLGITVVCSLLSLVLRFI